MKVLTASDVIWWLADVMGLADSRGPDVAQFYTLAGLTLLVSLAQLFQPPSTPTSANVAEARAFIGTFLKEHGRCPEHVSRATARKPFWGHGLSPI